MAPSALRPNTRTAYCARTLRKLTRNPALRAERNLRVDDFDIREALSSQKLPDGPFHLALVRLRADDDLGDRGCMLLAGKD